MLLKVLIMKLNELKYIDDLGRLTQMFNDRLFLKNFESIYDMEDFIRTCLAIIRSEKVCIFDYEYFCDERLYIKELVKEYWLTMV